MNRVSQELQGGVPAPMTGVQSTGSNLDGQLTSIEEATTALIKRLGDAGLLRSGMADQQPGDPNSNVKVVDTRCPHAIFLQHSGDRVRDVRLQIENLLDRLDV